MPPALSGNGLAMRAALFLEALACRHRVHVAVVPLAAADTNEIPEVVQRHARTYTVLELEDAAEARDWPARLLSTAAGRQRAAEVYPLPAVCRRLAHRPAGELHRRARGARGVHVMRSYLAPSLDFLLDDPARAPVTLDVDEVDSHVALQLGADTDAERLARLEAHYLARFDHVFAASAPEADAVRRVAPHASVSVVPNAPPPPAAGAGRAAEAREFDLLFVGNLSYAPNVAGAKWLCDRVAPLLPGARVALVGSHPAREVRALGERPGVSLAADVPEVSSWYARSRIAVAPLLSGGGTRTKILEAMIHAVPVVATSRGAAGLLTGPEHGVLVADTPPRFAATCGRLLADPDAAAQIGLAGRAAAPDRAAVIAALATRFTSLFPAR